jgi:hypothetical protein
MSASVELLALARRLSLGSGHWQPNDAELRRAVSTAYYALFHKIAGTAAERFMGPGQQSSAGYALLYRGFEHRKIREICEVLEASTLKNKYKFHLRRAAVSKDMQEFARALPSLQEARHLADYDPAAQFLPVDVASLIDAAELALQAFDRVAADEQADVLALMMLGARG